MHVLYIEDHLVLHSSLRALLSDEFPGCEVIACASEREASRALQARHFDLVIADLHLPDSSRSSVVRLVRGAGQEAPVLVFSGSENDDVIVSAMTAGAAGFVFKTSPPQDLLGAVKCVLSGSNWYPARLIDRVYRDNGASEGATTVRQLLKSLPAGHIATLRLLVKGQTNKQICRQLGVAEITIKRRVSELYKIFKIPNASRVQLVLAVEEHLREQA